MNLLDLYAAEVGKHLPRKNRADIEAEIRSTLEDMLEERKQGKTEDEDALVISLLKEYGAPKQVAARYKPAQYLISPRMYPIFEMVTGIVFIIFFAVSLFGLGVGIIKTDFTGMELLTEIGKWLGGLFGGLTAALGNLVLVFAIIERTRAADEFEKEFNDWDPADLTSEPDSKQTKIAEFIVAIIFTAFGLIILNVYPHLIAIGFFNDNGVWTFIPIFSKVFFGFLMWINLQSALQIAFNSFMLSQREWKPATRALSLVVEVLGAILAVIILTTPDIFAVTAESFAMVNDTEAVNILAQMFNFLPKLILAIVVIATSVKVVQTGVQIFKESSAVPYPRKV